MCYLLTQSWMVATDWGIWSLDGTGGRVEGKEGQQTFLIFAWSQKQHSKLYSFISLLSALWSATASQASALTYTHFARSFKPHLNMPTRFL